MSTPTLTLTPRTDTAGETILLRECSHQPENNSIIFCCGPDSREIMRLDKNGMIYKGHRIDDAGEAHRAFLEVMSATKEGAK
jgi:hypothetical protein